jgi:predicted transcriptional regulator
MPLGGVYEGSGGAAGAEGTLDEGLGSDEVYRFIYFIRSGKYVKIGIAAHSPDSRLTDLQGGNPELLTLDGFLRLGLCSFAAARLVEADLHDRFSKQRVRGEWFRVSSRLSALINSSVSGRVRYCTRCQARPAISGHSRCAVCGCRKSPLHERQELAHLLYERGDMTVGEIADYLRATEPTVRSYLRPSRPEQRIHDVSILHDRGQREDVIADELGLSVLTVKRYLREGE